MYKLRKDISVHFFILLVTDALLIFATLFLVLLIRFRFDMDAVHYYDPYYIKIFCIVLIHLFFLSYFGLYDPSTFYLNNEIFTKIGYSILLSSGVLFLAYYIYPPIKMGRGVWIGNLIALPIVLLFARWIYVRSLAAKIHKQKVLIVGTGELAREVARKIIEWEGVGLSTVGFLDINNERLGLSLVNPKIIGSYADIESIVDKEKIEKVIVALADRRNQICMDTLLKFKLRGIRVVEGADFLERTAGRIPISQLRPSWLVFTKGFQVFHAQKIAKRVMDILLSVFALILSSPLFIVAAVMIKLDSAGPVFFRQTRIGENAKLFTLIKFRTMTVMDESEDNCWSEKGDARITRSGAFLRRTRIDELPQFINVLKGEMSIVGTRPDITYLKEQLEKEVPFYTLRYSIKPGITGWAQIKYRYVSSVEEGKKRHEYDLYYIKNFSFLLDIWIMLKTIHIVLARAGSR